MGCGLPTRDDIDMAQTVTDMAQAVQELQGSQQDLQDRIDSLTTVVLRQDSVLRSMANLMGAPLPPR